MWGGGPSACAATVGETSGRVCGAPGSRSGRAGPAPDDPPARARAGDAGEQPAQRETRPDARQPVLRRPSRRTGSDRAGRSGHRTENDRGKSRSGRRTESARRKQKRPTDGKTTGENGSGRRSTVDVRRSADGRSSCGGRRSACGGRRATVSGGRSVCGGRRTACGTTGRHRHRHRVRIADSGCRSPGASRPRAPRGSGTPIRAHGPSAASRVTRTAQRGREKP